MQNGKEEAKLGGRRVGLGMWKLQKRLIGDAAHLIPSPFLTVLHPKCALAELWSGRLLEE